jgi:hypothetical protein
MAAVVTCPFGQEGIGWRHESCMTGREYDWRRSSGTDGARLVLKSGFCHRQQEGIAMIRKLKSGQYRLYSRKLDPKTGRRRNLGTFASRAAAEKHERAVQYFKRH